MTVSCSYFHILGELTAKAFSDHGFVAITILLFGRRTSVCHLSLTMSGPRYSRPLKCGLACSDDGILG